MFDIKQIQSFSTKEDYLEGYNLYIKGTFTPRNITMTSEDAKSSIKRFQSAFHGKKVYQLAIEIDNRDGLISFACDCQKKETLCSHLVALALSVCAFLNKCSIESPTESDIYYQGLESKKKAQRFNDIIDKMRDNVEISMKNGVHIEPMISWGNPYLLGLKIGFDKMYIIRSIKDFLVTLEKEDFYEYGKNLGFKHYLDCFDNVSQKFIMLLMQLSIDFIPTNSRQICISSAFLEQLLDIYRGNSICLIGAKDKNYYIEKDDFSFVFKLLDTHEITIDNKEAKIKKLFHNEYIIKDSSIAKVKRVSKASKVLIDEIIENGSLDVSQSFDEFTSKLYPRIKNDLEVYEGFCDDNALDDFKIDSYLDIDDEGICIRQKYRVKGEPISPNEASFFYESYLFSEYENLLSKLGCLRSPQGYTITDPANMVFFINSDLGVLKAYGDVFLSEKFKNTLVKKIQPIMMNVRYNAGLLDICFDNMTYTPEELNLIMKAYHEEKRYVKLNNQIVELDDSISNVDKIFKELDLSLKENSNQRPLYNLFKLFQYQDNIIFDDYLEQVLSELKDFKKANFSYPDGLKDYLREYQIDAFKWLKTLAKHNLGGILADDMGLGKTLEMISLILSDEVNKPTLIVSPMSLIYNWQNELKRWGKSIDHMIIVGTALERERLISSISPESKTVCITSYDSLRRDIEQYENIDFRFIIIDEGQYIKNFGTKKAKAVKILRSDCRFALTGTPIENNVLDLWSLFDFILPGYLSTHVDFLDGFEDVINDHEALDCLMRKIAPFVLRRTKDMVLKDLPLKNETVYYAGMGEKQRKLYEAYLLQMRNKLNEDESKKLEILTLLTRLRQICVDPRMFISDYDGEAAKIDVFFEILLRALSGGHKVLVFSQFKRLFADLSKLLNEKDIKHFIITGETESKRRVDMVDEFNKNDNVKVFLISLKAGGTGLNLTGADVVIHFDPWWNVSAENQATDRAHRIGQKRSVQVIKLICENTIEQRVLELQDIKRTISDSVLGNTQEMLPKLNINDIKFLLE